MAKLQKIVWYEGMKLDPHHFQQLGKFTDFSIVSNLRNVSPHLWGLSGFQIDTASLAAGTFGLVACTGVTPDGLIFNMPSNDQLPKARSFKELFSAMDERLEVFLCIPLENENGRNCQLEDVNTGNTTRFKMVTAELFDDNLGINPSRVDGLECFCTMAPFTSRGRYRLQRVLDAGASLKRGKGPHRWR